LKFQLKELVIAPELASVKVVASGIGTFLISQTSQPD